MRKLPLPLLVAVAALPTAASAAPKPCTDPLRAWENETRTIEAANHKAKAGQQMPMPKLMLDGSHLDCLKDDVLVLNGEGKANLPGQDATMIPPAPLVTSCTPNVDDKTKLDCVVDYRRAVQRALDLIGPVPDTQWDEIVVFGQMMSPQAPPGPLFYREGRNVDASGLVAPGVNEVDHIGLPYAAETQRTKGRPMVGFITAGGTEQIASFLDPKVDAPEPRLPV